MVAADRPDSEPSDWVFYQWIDGDDDRGPRRIVRPQYAMFACPRCKKYPEITVLEHAGIPADFILHSQWDYIRTADGVICVSQRSVEILNVNKIRGLRFLTLPGDDRYRIAVPAFPEGYVAVDIASCGVELRGLCPICMRYGKILYWPQRRAMRLPQEDLIICSLLVFAEDQCREFHLMTTDRVAEVFQRENVTGVELISHGF
jgi:hypothetical protein